MELNNYDQNALYDMVLIRDYTDAEIEHGSRTKFNEKEEMEFWRMWRLIPHVLFDEAKRWNLDIKTLIHYAAYAWIKIQDRPEPLILLIKNGRVGLELTMQKESESEVRIDLRQFYLAGYTFFETLLIIAADMRGKRDLTKDWRRLRDALNKLVNKKDGTVPLILTKIGEIIYHKM